MRSAPTWIEPNRNPQSPAAFWRLLVWVLLACPALAQAQHRAVRFEKTGLKQALAKAKKENKLIFVDCYTPWCGPCLWLKKTVFTNDTVADFFNANFICVELDLTVGEGIAFAKKHNILAYPTLMFLDGTGSILHRSCGASPPAYLVETGQQALNPRARLSYYASQFKTSPTNAHVAYRYFDLLQNACQMHDSVVRKYLAGQKNDSLSSVDNWKIIYSYAGYQTKAYRYFEANRAVFSKLYGRDSVEAKIDGVYADRLYNASLHKNKKEFELLKARFKKLNTKNREQVLQHADLSLVKRPNADLEHAIDIVDSIVGPLNVSKGFGTVKDVLEEANSAWFRLNIARDTLLTFDIVPIDSLDDYDFSLFKCPEGDCIQAIRSKTSKPARRCYSYCTSKSGVTGLSAYTQTTNVGGGHGPAYVSAIRVKAGETYYLEVDFANIYIDRHRSPLGFSIYFYNYWPKRQPIVLNSVLFENDRARLSPRSFPELDKLAAQLKTSQMRIEICGHTDNTGGERQNQLLSEARAKAVMDYLIAKHISPDRLFYKGYGSTKPIASNESSESRRKNRRVEFVIVMN